MAKLIFFSIQFSVSHDHSEIILICWFSAQKTFIIIIRVENSNANFCGDFLFQESFFFFPW